MTPRLGSAIIALHKSGVRAARGDRGVRMQGGRDDASPDIPHRQGGSGRPMQRNQEVRTMRMMALGLAAAMAVSVAGCDGSNQTTGAVIGAGTGALIGSQFGRGSGRIAATAIGAVLGAAIGSEIGRRLDERDRMMYAQAAQVAAESQGTGAGATQSWSNPQ